MKYPQIPEQEESILDIIELLQYTFTIKVERVTLDQVPKDIVENWSHFGVIKSPISKITLSFENNSREFYMDAFEYNEEQLRDPDFVFSKFIQIKANVGVNSTSKSYSLEDRILMNLEVAPLIGFLGPEIWMRLLKSRKVL